MFLLLLHQLPQLLDLGGHAALGGTAQGSVLLHTVDKVEDLGDITAEQGAGEAKKEVSVQGDGCWLLALHAQCLQIREWRLSLIAREKPLAALPLLLTDRSISW